jgi:hypothetical protein
MYIYLGGPAINAYTYIYLGGPAINAYMYIYLGGPAIKWCESIHGSREVSLLQIVIRTPQD